MVILNFVAHVNIIYQAPEPHKCIIKKHNVLYNAYIKGETIKKQELLARGGHLGFKKMPPGGEPPIQAKFKGDIQNYQKMQ